MLLVRITDNGVGFDMENIDEGYDERGSFGMVNMKERAALLDGTLEIQSTPGRGTSITVAIPAEEAKPPTERVGRLPTQMTKLERSAMKRVREL